jgi:hypothetical protein
MPSFLYLQDFNHLEPVEYIKTKITIRAGMIITELGQVYAHKMGTI